MFAIKEILPNGYNEFNFTRISRVSLPFELKNNYKPHCTTNCVHTNFNNYLHNPQVNINERKKEIRFRILNLLDKMEKVLAGDLARKINLLDDLKIVSISWENVF